MTEQVITDEQFTAEYSRCYAALLSYVTKMTRSADLAEDVVAEAWLRAWRNRKYAGRNGASFKSWITAIARNYFFEHKRKEMSRGGGKETLSLESVVVEDLTGAHPNRRIELQRAFASVDEKTQAVVKMQFVYGFGGSEIASRLGITIPAVKARSFRGLRTMRARLENG
jgi:RNA polymerase sigma-70 factor (ECF subfamily)